MMLFGMDPDEYREALARQADQHEARATVQFLDLHAFLEKQSVEDLELVKWMIFKSMSESGYGHHMMGLISAVERYVHDVCGCTPLYPHKVQDHSDPEFLTGTHVEEPDFPEETGPARSDHAPTEEPDPKVKLKTHRGEEIWMPLTEALETYNLEWYEILSDMRPGETLRKLRCKGCGIDYVTIADRALEKPGEEGCHGCIQQAKWGGGDPWGENK